MRNWVSARSQPRAQVLTMSLLVVSHGHMLRVTIRRRRAAKTRRMTTDCFVSRAHRTCKRCLILSRHLERECRQFRTRALKLMTVAEQ
jgi:hypothetical protein